MSPKLAEIPKLVVVLPPPLLLGTTDDERIANPLTGFARTEFKLPAILPAVLFPPLKGVEHSRSKYDSVYQENISPSLVTVCICR